MLRIYFITLILFVVQGLKGQPITQSIRGTITDKITHQPLEGATIVLLNTDPLKGAKTDEQGRFEINAVLIGRYDIQINYIGYNPLVLHDVMVHSAKEIILNIEMEERVVTTSKDILIRNRREKDKPLNDMAMVSARVFSVEETGRYAGSLNDPARMAQNFAGVQANGDTRNDIIIRGNSPLGVQWRLEGIDIPNPNHFSGIGTSGGAISILNNNNLSNSDFLTGAFPAQYGNATAGIFDLRLRNGNDKKREYTVMFGMNGIEAGAEGPINKEQHSSYIVNYRYSTLGLFQTLGINFGAASVPKYQDAVFKIHLPSKKWGVFDLFAIGGYNTSAFYSKDYDTTGRKLNPLPKGFNTYFTNYMGVAGLGHAYNFSSKTFGKLILTYSVNGNQTTIDSLYENETKEFKWLNRNYVEDKLNAQYMLTHKFNSRHNTQLGLYYSHTFFKMQDSFYVTALKLYRKILDYNGDAGLFRAFLQHQYKMNEQFVIVAGIHAMNFTLNPSLAIEPRLGMKYQARKNIWLSLGTGIHQQQQPMITYFYQTRMSNGVDSATNTKLGFTRSAHVVLGLDWLMAKDFRLKFETYYQSLSKIPIEQISSSYSLVNQGAFYFFENKPHLINRGKGYNIGAEMTLEKFFSRNYYFLITGSLYRSMYKGSDQVERHTAFDGTYAVNMLLGYDLILNKKSLLSINAKATLLGGRRYTPLDEAASKQGLQAVYIDSLAFTLQHPAYFRPDIRIAYRLNWKKVSQEFALNINNFINRDNIQSLEYDRTRNAIGYSYQIGFFPVIQYRLEF
ncbi:MAG: TonB-dependent receptor [Chitinophagaceae bacterium]|nr:TonB-dependent receptor [Chitinophagaceae bacterium]